MSAARLDRRHLRVGALTVGLAALGAGAVALVQSDPAPEPAPARRLAERTSAPAAPAAAPRVERSEARLPDPTAPAPPGRGRPQELPPLASAWRGAVLNGQREAVLLGARALRGAPDARAQLLLLAADPEPRVRAFALRELGRRRDPSLAEVFQRAASDPSPYVVENARWGLAQLASASGPAPRSAR